VVTAPRYDLAILRQQATEAAAIDGAFVDVDGEDLLAVLDALDGARNEAAMARRVLARLMEPGPPIEHDLYRALVDVGQLELENTVLVEQWHEAAVGQDRATEALAMAVDTNGEALRLIWTNLDATHRRDRALDACAARIAELLARRDALLALVWNTAQSTPLPDEVPNALDQRGALMAEVGTLRAQVQAVTWSRDEARRAWARWQRRAELLEFVIDEQVLMRPIYSIAHKLYDAVTAEDEARALGELHEAVGKTRPRVTP
jgi:hypothetical protein